VSGLRVAKVTCGPRIQPGASTLHRREALPTYSGHRRATPDTLADGDMDDR